MWAPAAVTAQTFDDDFFNRLGENFNQVSNAYNSARPQYDQSVASFNSTASQLAASRDSIAASTDVVNNVISYRRKSDLDNYLSTKSADQQAWEQKFASGDARRIQIVNPYDSNSYTRYYDEKGDWKLSVLQGDYNTTKFRAEEWTTYYNRAKQQYDNLDEQYNTLLQQQGQMAALQSQIADQRKAAAARLSEFSPQSSRPESDATLPSPGRYNYLAITGNDRAEWDLVVGDNGRVSAQVNLNGTLYNVTGTLKMESGRVMVWWNTGGSGLRNVGGGSPQWRDMTANVANWKRVP
jgi:hypothetical protein